MKISKRIKFFLITVIAAVLFAACSNPNGENPSDKPGNNTSNPGTTTQLTPTLDYDKNVYTILMNDVIDSAKDFVNKSILLFNFSSWSVNCFIRGGTKD